MGDPINEELDKAKTSMFSILLSLFIGTNKVNFIIFILLIQAKHTLVKPASKVQHNISMGVPK